MTRFEEIKQLKAKLKQLQADREVLEAQRSEKGTSFEEFLSLSNRISAISVRQYTTKVKIHNMENNQPRLGKALPAMTEVTNINAHLTGGFKKS